MSPVRIVIHTTKVRAVRNYQLFQLEKVKDVAKEVGYLRGMPLISAKFV